LGVATLCPSNRRERKKKSSFRTKSPADPRLFPEEEGEKRRRDRIGPSGKRKAVADPIEGILQTETGRIRRPQQEEEKRAEGKKGVGPLAPALPHKTWERRAESSPLARKRKGKRQSFTSATRRQGRTGHTVYPFSEVKGGVAVRVKKKEEKGKKTR